MDEKQKTTKMPSRDPATDIPLNGPDVPVEQKRRQLQGQRPEDQQDAFFDASDVDELAGFTSIDQYEGELEAGVADSLPTAQERLDLLTERELREGETDDAFEAAEEGLTYIPPIDPPTVPSDDFQSAQVASGMGVSSLDEPYDADHHSTFLPTDEVRERVREALRADSSTTQYAETITIIARGGLVILRGMVADLDDSDNVVAVTQFVEGVEEVIDQLRVRSLEG